MATSSKLDAAYAAQIKAVRARLSTFLRGRFLAGEFRDADADRFLAAAIPVVLAGRRQVSAMTDAYLSRQLGIRAAGPIDTDTLRGVAVGEVYMRPYVTVRMKLAEGLALDAAASAGTARLVDLVVTDVQLAKTVTSRASFERAGVKHYKRTLTGSASCQLCSTASGHVYRTGELMPIHPGCDCGVQAVPGSPRTTSSFGKGVTVREHGELGPLLVVAGQHFTGPSAIH